MEAQRSEVTYTSSHSHGQVKGLNSGLWTPLALTMAAVTHVHPKAGRIQGSTEVGPVPRGEKKILSASPSSRRGGGS